MKLIGNITFKGDKSISHRAIMLASICNGESIIANVPDSEDINSTISALRNCGISIKKNNYQLTIVGNTFKTPKKEINCQNSGTTMRLLSGLLSFKKIKCSLIGDSSLSRRPMDRIVGPMNELGIKATSNKGYPPINLIDFKDTKLDNITIDLPSAQVKSCIIFSLLGTRKKIRIYEKFQTRNHLELMIKSLFKELITVNEEYIEINPINYQKMNGFNIEIPGDISSASYFIVAASLIDKSRLVINNLLLNKSRIGIIDSLIKMGANIDISYDKKMNSLNEPTGTVIINGVKALKAVNISPDHIPSMIDEIPILSLACAYAKGQSTISGLDELKYKESNRLNGIYNILRSMGVDVKLNKNSIKINGSNKLYNTNKLNNYNDHRLAMMISIAQMKESNLIEYPECINISFPDFKNILDKVMS